MPALRCAQSSLISMTAAVVAVCTYNRADRLPALVRALRLQQTSARFSLLFIDNNSTDATAAVLSELQAESGPPMRVVLEANQGIVHARNRAIDEAMDAEYLLFIDDDELPSPGWIEAAVTALRDEGADCVGGRIRVGFGRGARPSWLGDELLGFLGEVDNGAVPLWVTTRETPIWSGNVGYRTQLFRDDPALRFDSRYNRAGYDVGGGEDAVMFRTLLERRTRLRYRPDMAIEHLVEPSKLRRRYFLRLHYRAGSKVGRFGNHNYRRTVAGVPPFVGWNALRQLAAAAGLAMRGRREWLRQAMNFTHSAGVIAGLFARWRTGVS
jgi:glycosyltransferase involved in cell wall biosynthesis